MKINQAFQIFVVCIGKHGKPGYKATNMLLPGTVQYMKDHDERITLSGCFEVVAPKEMEQLKNTSKIIGLKKHMYR